MRIPCLLLCMHAPDAMAIAASGGPAIPDTTEAATKPEATAAGIDAASIARAARATHRVPGLVCAIVDKDGLRAVGADGLRAAGASDALTVDDRMHLGSCTKAFTATLAAAMVADGTLHWDSTVGEVLGKAFPAMHDGWRAVTLEQLLRHRGGAPANAHPDDWSAAWACTDSPRACRAAFVGAMFGRTPAEAPGTFVYSNQGYAIAGHMMETVAGEEYEALLARRVLGPLGITHAGFGPPTRAEPESPAGHDDDGTVRDIDNPAAIAPAGLLHMPVGEWARFVAFHLGATPPKELAGAAAQLGRLHAPSDGAPREALGWKTAERPWGGPVLMHAGSNSKWYCVAWLAPEKGFAILAATNQGGDAATRACDEACAALIGARAKENGAPAPRAEEPAPRAEEPAPRAGEPAPRAGDPAPRAGDAAPHN